MPQDQPTFLTGDFVISAGSVLFRRAPNDSKELQVCLIHTPRNSWLLPKGRKDAGESMEAAAIRETYEETGYVCELVPVRMPTRATAPGDGRNTVTIRDNIIEPIAIATRDVVRGTVKKFIWWFIARVKEGHGEKVEGTQMANESYESHFFDIGDALTRLSFPADRDIVTLAVQIVEDTEKKLERDVIF